MFKYLRKTYITIHSIILFLFKKNKILNKIIPTLPYYYIYSINEWLKKSKKSKKIIKINDSYSFNWDNNIHSSQNKVFKKYTSYDFPEIFIANLVNTLVCTNSGFVIDKKTKSLFVETNIYGKLTLKNSKLNNSLKIYPKILKTENSKATYLLSSENYYHWHFEFLCRLININEYLQSDIIIYSKSFNKDWQKQLLKIYKIEEYGIRIIPEDIEYLSIPEYYFISFGGIGAGIPDCNNILKLQKHLFSNFTFNKNNDKRYKRIYISRAKANHRKVINENELISMLEEFDFITLNMEDYTVEEQYNIFSQAEIIIAVHGPSLTNLIASDKKVIVIELLNEFHLQMCYFHIATVLGLRYHALLCKSIEAKEQRLNSQVSNNIIVDITKLQALILNILKDYL